MFGRSAQFGFLGFDICVLPGFRPPHQMEGVTEPLTVHYRLRLITIAELFRPGAASRGHNGMSAVPAIGMSRTHDRSRAIFSDLQYVHFHDTAEITVPVHRAN